MILRCPGSDYLWTVAIVTTRNAAVDWDNLRQARERFECPTP